MRCSVPECQGAARSRGMCNPHYQRRLRHGDPLIVKKGGVPRKPEAERFWSKVEKSDGCWLWTGALNKAGYGVFMLAPETINAKYKPIGAHRYAYEALVGAVPDGLHLDHLCRITACVRPDHLEPVTPAENYLRGVGFGAVNARKTHCHRDHPFNEANTRVDPKTGKRICRACARLRYEQSLLKLTVDTPFDQMRRAS